MRGMELGSVPYCTVVVRGNSSGGSGSGNGSCTAVQAGPPHAVSCSQSAALPARTKVGIGLCLDKPGQQVGGAPAWHAPAAGEQQQTGMKQQQQPDVCSSDLLAGWVCPKLAIRLAVCAQHGCIMNHSRPHRSTHNHLKLAAPPASPLTSRRSRPRRRGGTAWHWWRRSLPAGGRAPAGGVFKPNMHQRAAAAPPGTQQLHAGPTSWAVS